MASLLGEGSLTIMSGSGFTATAPQVIADFRTTDTSKNSLRVDGPPCNAYTLANFDSSGSLYLCAAIAGLHSSNATGTNLTTFQVIAPGTSQVLQYGEHGDQISYIQGFLCTASNATASFNALVGGGVTSRRSA